jgi:hypothetical protein
MLCVATLTEVFPCFFLSCKGIIHKDGARPALPKLVNFLLLCMFNFFDCYVCSILCILCIVCVLQLHIYIYIYHIMYACFTQCDAENADRYLIISAAMLLVLKL